MSYNQSFSGEVASAPVSSPSSTPVPSAAQLSTPTGKWRLHYRQYSLLVEKRSLVMGALLLALLLVGILVSVSVGSAKLTPWSALQAFFGEASRIVNIMVFKIRLPRVMAVVVAGAALGLSGCLIQTLVRNRLATPDMIGVNEGATLAITFFTLYITLGTWPWWAAPIGAVMAAVLLYLLCKNPGEQGYLFVVIGIGVSELMRAVGEFLMSTESIVHVSSVYMWTMGNFVGQGYETSVPVAVLLLLLCPFVVYLSRQLNVLRLGVSSAQSLGVNVNRVQLSILMLAILIAALGTAIGGPIVFIAMAGPILVSYCVKNRIVPLWNAALLGALLLLFSDTLVRVLADPHEVATGIMTRILGGIMLLVFLLRDKGSAD
ncbi:iron chelate uptake ABC transporter family permease subunit [Photobacterium sp. OFAV2-7]|uniref:FecCD family ABC transporter permease n=1 Tax=Photobacterium sp. OFAV2-7 TaxID=2917748 RepID=UPI00272BF2CF|nr:iron ABC transporter permease [Photobacterium sp. OFAV2-7]